MRSTPKAERPRVLVVDDEDPIRDMLAEFLDMEGYDVSTAEDGDVALEELAKAPYDVVLTDLKMPRKNGLSLLGEIHERKPDCKVIIMTAYGDQDTCSEALRRGACAYLNKPVSRAELLALCGKALGEP